MTERISTLAWLLGTALEENHIHKDTALKLYAHLNEMSLAEKARQEILREVCACGLYNRRVSQTLYRKVKAITED